MTKQNKMPHGSLANVMHDYNSHFADQPKLKVTYNIVNKRFLATTRAFSNRWHPCDSKETYLQTFSSREWDKLDSGEKSSHTLTNCQICSQKYSTSGNHFPGKKKKTKVPCINFSQSDFSTPASFGKTLLKEANKISKSTFDMPINSLIAETPQSKLVKQPTKKEQNRVRRRILCELKDNIEEEMNQASDSLFLQNRISWSTFDNIRKQEGLTRKRANENDIDGPPPKRKKHGTKPEHQRDLIDTDQLLNEARQWEDNYTVNWTALGSKYGLAGSNRGQVIKEYLASHNIPSALVEQRENRAPRRAKKKLPDSGGRVSFPMYQPVKKQKDKVTQKVNSREILLGNEIVPTSYTTFRMDTETNSITEVTKDIHAREIPIWDIRKKLLTKHEQLGITRDYPDIYFKSLTREECCAKLQELSETIDPTLTDEQLQQKLQEMSRTRQFKLWHDHSDIAGHSHFLTLVSTVYDPAFYFTTEEMRQRGVIIDVPTTVESPEVHIIARSCSSLCDQRKFNESRQKSLSEFIEPILTTSGIPIQDKVRFFHGDGPAAQFEAGNKIGWYYCCVGCDISTNN